MGSLALAAVLATLAVLAWRALAPVPPVIGAVGAFDAALRRLGWSAGEAGRCVEILGNAHVSVCVVDVSAHGDRVAITTAPADPDGIRLGLDVGPARPDHSHTGDPQLDAVVGIRSPGVVASALSAAQRAAVQEAVGLGATPRGDGGWQWVGRLPPHDLVAAIEALAAATITVPADPIAPLLERVRADPVAMARSLAADRVVAWAERHRPDTVAALAAAGLRWDLAVRVARLLPPGELRAELDGSPDRAAAAAVVLAERTGEPAAAGPLRARLRRAPSPDVCSALGACGPSEAVPELAEAARATGDDRVRLAARSAMERIRARLGGAAAAGRLTEAVEGGGALAEAAGAGGLSTAPDPGAP